MPATVSTAVKNSISSEIGICEGDEILSIDGIKMQDMIDYNYLCKSELVTLEVKKNNGEIEEIVIEKDYDEDLGIVFESAVFDRVKPCLNHCIFCFVDQQPKGLRKSLYIKDDDYRLSYLQGTYITLTNFSEEDKERIKRMHLGPFYVSVHTTNPKLRVKMLNNPNAGNIMDNLKWFRKNKIPFHAQIVLCPDVNDGDELERTLRDLAELKNTVLSAAIVPVGITKFRKNLLKQVDRECAEKTLNIASKFRRVCCSDEFFLLAERDIPPAKYYGKYPQLDDGVGSIRLLLENFKRCKLPQKIEKPLKLVFATSYAAKDALDFIAKKFNKIKNLKCEVCPVKSEYWGRDITVAGLITADDLIRTVKYVDADYVIIPSIMLRAYTQEFLDGKNLDYVKKNTGKDFFVIQNIYSVDEIINLINL